MCDLPEGIARVIKQERYKQGILVGIKQLDGY